MSAQTNEVKWPTRYDYDMAMHKLSRSLRDPELRRGKLQRVPTGILQYAHPFTHVCLYRIDNWMIRCFCRVEDREPSDELPIRYQMLETFYQRNHARVSALIPIYYLSDGIELPYYQRDPIDNLIEIKKPVLVPIVKMHFVEGQALGTFIMYNHRNRQAMELLAEAWLRMVCEMEAIPMAHGDLDLTNVLVQERTSSNQLHLKLIDYDNAWIPEFARADFMLPEHGHEAFQHPAFYGKPHKYNEELDRFSALSIYISLRTLITYADLYDQWSCDEVRLLFTPDDYLAEQRRTEGGISKLRAMHVRGLDPYLDALSFSLRENRVPESLTRIANAVQQRDFAIEEAEHIQPGMPKIDLRNREIIVPFWDEVQYNTRGVSNDQQYATQHAEPTVPPAREPVQPASQPLPRNEPAPANLWEAPPQLQVPPVRQNSMPQKIQEESLAEPQEQPSRLVLPLPASLRQSSWESIQSRDRTEVATSGAQQTAPGRTPTGPQPRLDLPTLIGCGVILLIILLVIVVIILVLNAAHAPAQHSSSIPMLSHTAQVYFSHAYLATRLQ